MYRFKIVMGDWSNDGHGMKEDFVVESTHPETELRAAFRKSVDKMNIGFDCNSDTKYHVACEYDDNIVCKEVVDIFLENGLNEDDWDIEQTGEIRLTDPDSLVYMILWFISCSMPEDFKYEIVAEDIPCSPIPRT